MSNCQAHKVKLDTWTRFENILREDKAKILEASKVCQAVKHTKKGMDEKEIVALMERSLRETKCDCEVCSAF